MSSKRSDCLCCEYSCHEKEEKEGCFPCPVPLLWATGRPAASTCLMISTPGSERSHDPSFTTVVPKFATLQAFPCKTRHGNLTPWCLCGPPGSSQS
eukprot:1126118-Pelagomonas_calceolata.AAC.4